MKFPLRWNDILGYPDDGCGDYEDGQIKRRRIVPEQQTVIKQIK
jgi:hypothetical protein